MLSILIPTYNYIIVPLVVEVKKQCDACGIAYEIIGLDDGSTVAYSENDEINRLEYCSFHRNNENCGRSSNINQLAARSQFDYLLILEADAFPCKKNYIESYVSEIKLQKEAVFGGVVYNKVKPPADSRLRWVFGHSRESKSLADRLRKPYDIVFTWNLLIRKDLFFKAPFDTTINTYGYEDLVFLMDLKKRAVTITQIENECIHLNDDKSVVFIEKYHSSLRNLKQLLESKTIHPRDTSLTKLYHFLKRMGLTSSVAAVFRFSKNHLLKNLVSGKPSMLLFDFYKIGYFCTLRQR